MNIKIYDSRNQLTNSLMTDNDFAWVLDPIGNRLTSANNGSGWTYLSNPLNQYTNILRASAPPREDTPTYDLDGNMTATGDGWRYVWNGDPTSPRLRRTRNRMTLASNSQHVVTYAYDHQGRMVVKTVDEVACQYLWDGYNIVAGVGTVATNWFVWGQDLSGSLQGAGGVGGLLDEIKDGVPFFASADANGNVTEYLGADGAIAAHYEYSPFGAIIAQSGDLAISFIHRFSTKPWCGVTELSEYELRKYGPGMGRWPSRDPIAETGGYNLYAFSLNSPATLMDPFGWEAVTVFRIHAIGDSMTYGVRTMNDPFPSAGDSNHATKLGQVGYQGWRGYMRQLLDEWGKDRRIRFEFVGGHIESPVAGNVPHDAYPGARTSRIRSLMESGDIVCQNDDIYILLIGMNDVIAIHGKPENTWPQHIAQTETSYGAIVSSINADEPILTLLGTLPKVTKLVKRRGYDSTMMNRVIVGLFNPLVRQKAGEVRGTVFDLTELYSTNPNMTDDGFHFSDAGNQAVARMLFEKITKGVSRR